MRSTSDRYRFLAAQARERACHMQDPVLKMAYAQMARDWQVLAEQGEWDDDENDEEEDEKRRAGCHQGTRRRRIRP
jgi:hypothetical protein